MKNYIKKNRPFDGIFCVQEGDAEDEHSVAKCKKIG